MTDLIAVSLVVAAAPAATAFPLWYGFTATWWRTPVGRALVTSWTALALLIDVSLLYYVTGGDVPEALRLTVYALIAVGCWLTLGALAHDRYQRRKARHGQPAAAPGSGPMRESE